MYVVRTKNITIWRQDWEIFIHPPPPPPPPPLNDVQLLTFNVKTVLGIENNKIT